jgi:hypothetical protein
VWLRAALPEASAYCIGSCHIHIFNPSIYYFVISKGPEEEKLLGSILLPSYKISPCSTEDRVYRKFAFKAEHTNMRTYHFAADTRELMVRWMNALSLASILQEGSRYSNSNSDTDDDDDDDSNSEGR